MRQLQEVAQMPQDKDGYSDMLNVLDRLSEQVMTCRKVADERLISIKKFEGQHLQPTRVRNNVNRPLSYSQKAESETVRAAHELSYEMRGLRGIK